MPNNKQKEKCKWNLKDDCNDCPYEGCPNYGARLPEGGWEKNIDGKKQKGVGVPETAVGVSSPDNENKTRILGKSLGRRVKPQLPVRHEQELHNLKQKKLEARAHKHKDCNFLDPNHGRFNLRDLFEHWTLECVEFIEAYRKRDLDNMREELADMSNLLDMMFETISEVQNL